MQFGLRKRQQAPAIIVVPLIDILIVLLIFLVVTTTFKQQQAAVKLTLPKSKESTKVAPPPDHLTITIANKSPYFYLGDKPVAEKRLVPELKARLQEKPDVKLYIAADTEAAVGKMFKAMDAAKEAGFAARSLQVFTKPAR